jgi:hypothetical protein
VGVVGAAAAAPAAPDNVIRAARDRTRTRLTPCDRHLFASRPSSPGAPTQLLSLAALLVDAPGAAAGTSSGAAARGGFAAAAAAAAPPPELTLRLVDIAPGVSVRGYLQAWEDQCRVVAQDGGRAALLVFTKATAARDCSNALGGGVRGAFRVERPPGAGRAAPQLTPAAAAGPNDPSRWHTISARGAGSGGGAPAAARAAAADPWADDAAGGRRAAAARPSGASSAAAAQPAAAGRLVLEDWEEAEASAAPDAPRRAPMRGLTGANPWAALEGGEGAEP